MTFHILILFGFVAFGPRRMRRPALVRGLASAALTIDVVIALGLPAAQQLA